MGADGHIAIVRRDKALEVFPDADELMYECSSLGYADELDGVAYYHLYWGDNIMVDVWDATEHIYSKAAEADKRRARLQEFLDWFYPNSTHWEVWT